MQGGHVVLTGVPGQSDRAQSGSLDKDKDTEVPTNTHYGICSHAHVQKACINTAYTGMADWYGLCFNAVIIDNYCLGKPNGTFPTSFKKARRKC